MSGLFSDRYKGKKNYSAMQIAGFNTFILFAGQIKSELYIAVQVG